MDDVQAQEGAVRGVTSTEGWIRRGRITWTYIGIIILTIFGLWFLRTVLQYIFTFVIGGVLAFLLRPVVSLFMRWKLSRGLSVLITALLLVVIIFLALGAVLPQVVAEVQQIATALSAQAQQLHASASEAKVQLSPAALNVLASAQKQAMANAADFLKQAAAALGTVLGGVVGIAFDLFLGFIIAIWFMLDGSAVAKWSLSVLPPAWREDARQVGIAFDRSFGGFIRGIVISMALMFAGMAVGFNLLHVPYATALAFLCGLLAIVPIVGGIVGGVIATLVSLTISPQLAVLTLVVVLVVEQLVDSVIEPIVMGEAVRLHPLAILFSLAIGEAVAGILGMIAAIPAAAAIYTIYLYFARKYGMLEPVAAKETA